MTFGETCTGKDFTHYSAEENDTGEVEPTIMWDTIKAVMRRKLISKTAYLNKIKRQKYDESIAILRNLERQQSRHEDGNQTNQIKEAREQINKMFQEEVEKKFRSTKQIFYESTQFLARRLRTQQIKKLYTQDKKYHIQQSII